jgi:hypothetical protein
MADLTNPYQIANWDLEDKTFYGFAINAATGKLTVDFINDGSQIELPVSDVLKDNQYRTWLWTKNTLQFTWDGTQKTHLLMEIK